MLKWERYLVCLENMSVQTRRKGVQPQVSVGSDGIKWRIFPRLHPGAVQQEVHLLKQTTKRCCSPWHRHDIRRIIGSITHWLPVVERLIAVWDVAEQSCAEACREQAFKRRRTLRSPYLPSTTYWPTNTKEEGIVVKYSVQVRFHYQTTCWCICFG